MRRRLWKEGDMSSLLLDVCIPIAQLDFPLWNRIIQLRILPLFFYWSDLRENILVTTYIPNLPKKIYAPTDPLEMAL
jgi:hypothetical protein